MSTLSAGLFYKIILLFASILSILAAAIYLFVRRETGAASNSVIVTLSLAALTLLFVFIKTAAPMPRIKELFLFLGAAGGIAFFICAVYTCVFFALRAKKSGLYAYVSPDLRGVYDYTEDIVLLLDRDGKITDVNQKERFSAVPELSPLFSLPDGADYNDFSVEWRREITASGETYIAQNAPISSDASAHLGSVLLLHCVTEEKAYENALAEQNTMLDSANRRLEGLVKMTGILEAEKARAQMLRRFQFELTDRIGVILSDISKLDFTDSAAGACRDDIEKIIAALRAVYKNVRAAIQSI